MLFIQHGISRIVYTLCFECVSSWILRIECSDATPLIYAIICLNWNGFNLPHHDILWLLDSTVVHSGLINFKHIPSMISLLKKLKVKFWRLINEYTHASCVHLNWTSNSSSKSVRRKFRCYIFIVHYTLILILLWFLCKCRAVVSLVSRKYK